MASINSEFCFLMGIDDGNIFFEIISDFKSGQVQDIAEALSAVSSGLLNNDIIAHLRNQIKEHPTKKASILKVIKKFCELNSIEGAPPLIDSLQVIHE